jgi:hypothetical protein
LQQSVARGRAKDFADCAVIPIQCGVARKARTCIVHRISPHAFVLSCGKAVTQVPAVFAAIVAMTAV